MEKYLYTYLRGLDKSDLGTFGETLVLEKPSLYSKLKDFSGVVHIKDHAQKYEELQKQYTCIAEYVFFEGYFDVNGKRKIYPTDIEFYYHEEDAEGLKDPIMYHTDDHEKSNWTIIHLVV